MTEYRVLADGVVEPGDALTDFRGKRWTFIKVERGPEYNGTAKLYVEETTSNGHTETSWRQSFYHHAFPGVTVEVVEDESDSPFTVVKEITTDEILSLLEPDPWGQAK